MSRVTIGIPVYNESDYLSDTLNSALSQTLSDIEIIISDNASTDKSLEIAYKYSNLDPRVRVIRQNDNKGPLNNFRATLDQASSPYFVWLGGHDIFENNYLEMAACLLDEDRGIVMVYPQKAIFIDKENNYLSSNACSMIKTIGIKKPIKRVKHILKNLHSCTNIHGVFRTNVLRQLPFEKVIGFDHLMLVAAGLKGHISDIDAIGIQRRIVRTETPSEAVQRWEEVGVFFSEHGVDPYSQLVNLHLSQLSSSKEIGILDIVCHYYSVRKILYKKFGISRRHEGKRV